ncbi:MAG: glycosyltransferase family protein [Planctomycetota bacterium]|jgi:glycosyltransferase involved in cell wall biosynthesis
MDNGPVNEFKKHLFKRFGIQSHLYEHSWEYEQYLRLAPPAIDALRAIGAAADSTIIVSHEFMGMPTALSAIMEPGCNFKTAFYAHEVATMRRIIEEHPGHDTMFYNAINHNHGKTKYAAEMFGDQSYYFKHVLVEASRHCDAICAVGDSIVDELRFLAPEFQKANINIVYNGIPAYKIGLHEKLESKRKLQQYCENLLGYKPDFVFTHVTRLVRSKGLWRDLQVLEHIEKEFRANGNTGVMFVLSTEVSQRQSNDIIEMESAYNWPAAHREGSPDLSGGEANFYAKVQEFNARSRNIKVVFINQFGFERRYCGMRMPSDMEFLDIRKGSDVEFGLSIYEPFGISQLEPLTFGGICVASGVCGCVGFVRDTANGKPLKNVIIADYTKLDNHYSGIENYQQIGMAIRKAVEEDVSEKIAMQIILQLPKDENEMQILLQEGYQLAKNMSWDMVVKKYLLQTLRTALQGQGRKFMCPHS